MRYSDLPPGVNASDDHFGPWREDELDIPCDSCDEPEAGLMLNYWSTGWSIDCSWCDWRDNIDDPDIDPHGYIDRKYRK